MISSSTLKHISSLRIPKYRETHAQTIAEGTKLITEMVRSGFDYEAIYATEEWCQRNMAMAIRLGARLIHCSEKELARMSALKSPQGILALLHTGNKNLPLNNAPVSLFCDRISDPGNLGTLLRIADWFGLSQVIMSPGTASIINPKVIQASMGSWFRVHHMVATLQETMEAQASTPAIYGAVMEGTPLQQTKVKTPAIMVLGNESEGLSKDVLSMCDYKVTIPRGGSAMPSESAESLNVAMAAGLFCYHFMVISATS